MELKQLKKSHWHFIACFLGHGVASQAALGAGYSKKNPRTIGCNLLHRPEILAGCLMQAIAMRAEGQEPDGRAVRQLYEIVPDRLGKGLNEHDFAGLPPVEEAFRQFCLALGLDQHRMMPLPMPALPRPAPDGTGTMPDGAEAAAAPAAAARPAPRAPLAPPPLRLPRKFKRLAKPSRYKALHGGRGSGKSHVFAELLVRRCFETPTRAVCIREVQRSLDQSVKRLLEDKIQALGLGAAFTVQADRILGPGEGRIIFQGMQTHTAESIKSLEGYDIAWVEEAQSLSKRSLELLRPTIRRPDSELWFSWNPTRPDDPVDQLFRGGPAPPRTTLIEANWTANPHFPKVLKAEMEWDRERDPDKYQHVWLGGYQRSSEARVFTNWRVEAFEAPAGARFLFGADWGFARDPTVLVRCFLAGRTLHVDHEAYRVGCEIDRTPALFDTVPEARRWPIVADGARPETISYMQHHGFPKLRAAAKGAGSVKEGVEFLKSCDILVHPRCRHLIDELALYSWRTDPRTGDILPELEDRENHAIDALRYALEGQRSGSTYDTSMRWVGPGLG
ncbi:PBSX family phage terminase large subunit [Inquilinus sp. Marseille-Q2685]|uniref:PBSX family phage terminase large subunit n=1 Tax=Inquilinus sp. Marseille-Q2685 TaxID=2866581 RepID=UPI001CE49329|nr:PBSX family phage terminase large subunit [Inquilinus sp. Marseille-Q2685]